MKQKIVIKLGGSSLQNPATLKELAQTVQGFRTQGFDVVVVHGGGPAINAELTRRGITWTFYNGQRQTTPEMIDVIESVLATDVNSSVVQSLKDANVAAVGLSGARDQILYCTQADPHLQQVGTVERVQTSTIEAWLEAGATPVIAPVGFGKKDAKFNVNADWAATKIAAAIGATALIFLTDQNGILDQNKKLVRKCTPTRIHAMIKSGAISGGMYTKVMAMISALDAGVEQVRVLNSTAASRLLSESTLPKALALPGTLLTAQPKVQRIVQRRLKPEQSRIEAVHGKAS